MKLKICKLPFSLFFLLLTGCGGSFNVVSKNNTVQELSDVMIIFNGRDVGGGILIPDAEKTFLNAHRATSVPEKASVSWATEDGKRHSQTVEVKRHLPKFFRSINIVIAINEDNTVSVSWEKD